MIAIEIKSYPTKTSYYVGETLNTSGLSLIATYSDGSSKTISSGFTCSPISLTSVGTKTITVTYNGKTANFTVNVSPITVTEISVKSMPSKTVYPIYDTLNTSGLVLKVSYSNGTSKDITSGFTCNPTSFTPPITTGKKTIYVSYEGKTTSFSVTVIERSVVSIEMYSYPETEYKVGDKFNSAGL